MVMKPMMDDDIMALGQQYFNMLTGAGGLLFQQASVKIRLQLIVPVGF